MVSWILLRFGMKSLGTHLVMVLVFHPVVLWYQWTIRVSVSAVTFKTTSCCRIWNLCPICTNAPIIICFTVRSFIRVLLPDGIIIVKKTSMCCFRVHGRFHSCAESGTVLTYRSAIKGNTNRPRTETHEVRP